jgi:hypothetical protein
VVRLDSDSPVCHHELDVFLTLAKGFSELLCYAGLNKPSR